MKKKVLIFFPWLRIEKEILTEKFSLIPFTCHPLHSQGYFDSSNYELIKRVITAYRSHGKTAASIYQTTILKLPHHELIDDLDNKEFDLIFDYRSALAFAGLAKRQFCGLGLYWNYSNFEIIIQPISGTRLDVAYSTSRRDGYTQNIWSEEEYSHYQPEHVSIEQVSIEEDFLFAILKAIDHLNTKLSSNILAAIKHYNSANTDSSMIDNNIQLILLCSAFEILLGNKQTKKEEFHQALECQLSISKDFEPTELNRMKDLQFIAQLQKNKFKRVYTLWAGDFYQARNRLRHGQNILQNTIWTEREHLLLASYLFPLLLKKFLSKHSFYQWIEKDEDQLNAFEHLACTKPFEDSSAWARAYNEAGDKIRHKKILEELKNI